MQRAALEKTWADELVTDVEINTDGVADDEAFSAGMVSGIFVKGSQFDLDFRKAAEPVDHDLARAEWEGMGICAVYDEEEPFE